MTPAAEHAQLSEAVKSLASRDSKVRVAASKALFSAGLREYNSVRKEVLSSDASWSALIGTLGDADAKVVESAAGAIAQVIGRYRRDVSAFEPLRQLLTHKNKQVRTFATRGLAYLEHADRWAALIHLLDDKAESVQREVVLAIGRSSRELSSADRTRAIAAMERFVDRAGDELKMITQNTIRGLQSIKD